MLRLLPRLPCISNWTEGDSKPWAGVRIQMEFNDAVYTLVILHQFLCIANDPSFPLIVGYEVLFLNTFI